MSEPVNIEPGWQFLSADFSLVVKGRGRGSVTLVRADKQAWYAMSYELKESEDGPPLFIQGFGMTLWRAIEDANNNAAKANPIPRNQDEH